MFLTLALLAIHLVTPVQSLGSEMSDKDFEDFMQVTVDLVDTYGESAGKGCLTGGMGAAPGGFQALCIGCALGAAGNVASDIVYPPKRENNAKEFDLKDFKDFTPKDNSQNKKY